MRQNRVSYSDRGYDRGYDRYEDCDHRYRRSLLTVVDTDHDPALRPAAKTLLINRGVAVEDIFFSFLFFFFFQILDFPKLLILPPLKNL